VIVKASNNNKAEDIPNRNSEPETQLDAQTKMEILSLENYCLQKLSGKGKFTFLPGGCLWR
jgi:hypothetical protein